MEKLNLETKNLAKDKFIKLAELFPNAITETILGQDEEGNDIIDRAIDADVLRQEIGEHVIEGREERYEFTWPDKRKSMLLANAPINKTLRPIREDSLNFDETENLYIEGDNLDVLKLLRETYLGKVKMIYIDPPYNTGNDFVYEDDFAQKMEDYKEVSGDFDEEGNRLFKNTDSNGRFHTDWLNMMYPRLRLARNLLTDDGVIFISIDDNEVDNLKKICNEVFGEDNFISILSVENNPKGRKNSAFVSVSSEYCVIYAKNKNSAYFIENVPKNASDMIEDEEGNFVHSSGKRVLVGENSFNKYVTKVDSDKNYSVYYRAKDRKLVIKREEYGTVDQNLIAEGYVKYYSHYNGRLVENTYTNGKFCELFEQRALEFSQDKIYEKNFRDTIRIKSQLVNREYEAIVRGKKMKYSMELTTTGAGTYIKNLFKLAESPFPAPKNVGYIKLLISLFESEPFIVLDFFSGSATTADAVMQLNAKDNGNRKYIMVQLPEKTDNDKFETICEIGKERIRRAGKKIKEDYPDSKFDDGFRVLRVDSSNMKDVYYKPEVYSQSFLDKMESNIKEDRNEEDLLFQVMLSLGIDLSSKIEKEKISDNKVLIVEDGFLISCFDEEISEGTVESIAKKQPYYAVFSEGKMSDSTLANFEQIFDTYSPTTIRKVI